MPNKQINQRKTLVKHPLFIEGITRSGKFLLANLLAAFPQIEPPQYYGLLENIPYLVKAGLIESATAQNMLRCEVDFHFYEMLIGRNFNLRRSDKSSIYNHPQYRQLMNRSTDKNRDQLLKRGKDHHSLFVIHEGMSFMPFYFRALPKLRVLHITRNPIALVYSWYQRGLGKRWGKDPLLFQLALDYQGQPVPWFALDWAAEYRRLSPMNRVIRSIIYLERAAKTSYQKLPSQRQHRILRISYESLVSQPSEVIKRMEKFLRITVSPDIQKILRREKLPNPQAEDVTAKLQFIKHKADSQLLQQLVAIADYEA